MRFAVLYSKKDLAGINIAEQFKKLFIPQIPIIELKKESIYSEDIDKLPELRNIDFIIFATRHQSAKKEHSLSLHAPGNWRGAISRRGDKSKITSGIARKADYGGKPGKVCSTSAFVLKYLFQQLNKNAQQADLKDYNITLECTHHGPLIEKPCCFIEIGSSEQQWQDKKSGQIIAKTIASLQNYKPNSKHIPVIGIGGPHYCPNFNKIQLNSEYAISHIIQEYALPLTEKMLKEAEQKTLEQIKLVLLDWKGCGNSEKRQQVLDIIKKSGLKVKRTY